MKLWPSVVPFKSVAMPLLLLSLLLRTSGAAGEALPGMSADGWYTWRVEAIAAAPAMCCYSWNAGTPLREDCRLDGRHRGFTSVNSVGSSDTKVQIYALLKNGGAARVRVLSTDCPISGAEPMDLGVLPVAMSLAWLQSALEATRVVETDLVPAIAMHAGNEAKNALSAIASADSRSKFRREAIFWLAETGASNGEQAIRDAIRNDTDEDVREHALFALSLLPDERGIADLMDIVRDSTASRGLREKALFWLAQSDSDDAIRYIDELLGVTAGL